jgi:hypothetical protein
VIGDDARDGCDRAAGGGVARTSMRPIVTLIDGATGGFFDCCLDANGRVEGGRRITAGTLRDWAGSRFGPRSPAIISMISSARA